MSRLSVVIPTHNRANLVGRAVRSAVEQGTEVIVVDDASTDGTPDVLKELAVEIHRVEDGPRGPCHARNTGVRSATRPLVLFLDDDDLLLPGAAAEIERLADTHPASELFLHNCRMSDGRTTLSEQQPPTELSYEAWLGGRFAGELKPVVRREVFDRWSFPDTGASGEGLLWGQVIRERPALISGFVIALYDVDHGGARLTTPEGLLARADRNARIADDFLELFGSDLKRVNTRLWRERVVASVTWHLLAGQRAQARSALNDAATQLPATMVASLAVATLLPRRVLRAAFRLRHRRW